MAINPTTVRVVANLTIKAVTDDEAQKNILLIVLAPIISVLLILMMSVYILSSPVSTIDAYFKGEAQKKTVEQFKSQYQSTVQLSVGTLVFNGKYPMPAEGAITSGYGMRMHPVLKKMKMHTGLDIGTASHCQIKSIADGQVARVGVDRGYGNYIIIQHVMPEETIYSVYAHLSKVFVFQDQELKQGSIIGLEGGEPGKDTNTGITTGHHLHFEIRKSENAYDHVNPVPYLFKDTK